MGILDAWWMGAICSIEGMCGDGGVNGVMAVACCTVVVLVVEESVEKIQSIKGEELNSFYVPAIFN